MMCMDCHDTSSMIAANVTSNGTFGGLMHAVHANNEAFTQMGGDCWSCHYASADGMQLWDEVKHQVLRGITNLSSEEMTGEFTWNQDKLVSRDDHFTYVWLLDHDSYIRYANDILELQPDPENDGMYDAWTITVDGEVDNPFTMSLSEMLETFPVETRNMAFECEINPMGGPLIANSTMTGIPLSAIIEYAQPKAGAK